MAEYLSPEWIQELATAVAESPEVGPASAGVHLGVDIVVGVTSYSMTISDGVVQVQPGRAAHADMELVQDLGTAVAIARGELNAQRAFVDGSVRLIGRADQLIAARPVLEAVDRATEGVRRRTSYA
ncbi:MAG: hypothetical protein JWL70_2038 [Acidimicrobiia bacterium]|nr:hypothetical protein [Acidimicrobiia bacterium]